MTSFRSFRLLLALLITAAALALAATARASFDGSTSGNPPVCDSCGTGGGGGGGGGGDAANFWLFPQSNYDHLGSLKWLANQSSYAPASNATESDYQSYDAEMTKALLGYPNSIVKDSGTRCDTGNWTSNTSCPLWYTKELQESPSDSNGGALSESYNDHGADPLDELIHPVDYVGAHAITVTWNVIVWRDDPREDPDHSQDDQPIFSRTIDMDGVVDCDRTSPFNGCYGATSVQSPGDYDQYWYYADSHAPGDSPSPFGVNGAGGSWSDPGGHVSAGALSAAEPGYQLDQRTCNTDWQSSFNGLRDNLGRDSDQSGYLKGGTHIVSQDLTNVTGNGGVGENVRPASAPWLSDGAPSSGLFTCYFEGSQIGPRYWQYARQEARAAGVSRSGSLPGDQFSNGQDPADASQAANPLAGAGLKEAILLQWSLPLQSDGGAPQLKYKILGAPGSWYAVQVVATDNRQQIIDQPGSSVWHENYLHAYIANPVPPIPTGCTPACCPPQPCRTPDTPSGAAPSAYVQLSGQTPVQTRDRVTQTLDVLADTPFTNFQALFPTTAILQHYTPQMAYNGSASAAASLNAYQPDDIDYSSLVGVVPTARPGPDLQHAFMDKAIEAQVPRVSRSDSGADSLLSSNTFASDWLQPTLANPCQGAQTSEADFSTGEWLAWPQSPDVCHTAGHQEGDPQVFNAWDDYFSGIATWEARWASSYSLPHTYGYITNQWLRCADDNTSPESGCADPNEALAGWLDEDSGIFQTQWAQGYVYVVGDHAAPVYYAGRSGASSDLPTGAGALRIVLKTNRGQDVTDAAVWSRSTTQVQGLAPDDTDGQEQSNTSETPYNPVANAYEMNFCSQGLPSSADHLALQGDRAVSAAELGDPGCGGYDVSWQWAQTAADAGQAGYGNCDAQPVYDGPAPVPGYKRFPVPSNPTGGLQDSGSYGQADNVSGMERSYPLSDVASGATVSPPFAGQRPGRKTSGSDKALFSNEGCSKSVSEDGLYNSGYWSFNYAFWPKAGPAKNCPFASDPNADTGDYGTYGLNTPVSMGGYRPDDSVGSITGGADVPGTSTNCNDAHWTYKVIHHPASCTGSGSSKVCTPAWDQTVKDKYIPDTYRYGFWYRTSVQWNWTGPCEPVDQISGWPSHNGVPDAPTDPSVELPANTDTQIDYVGDKVSWPDTPPPDATSYGDKADAWNAGGGYGSNLVDDGASALISWRTSSGAYTRLTGQELQSRACNLNAVRSGYDTAGSWVLHTGAGAGFGEQNTGPRLAAGGYVAQFTFGGLTASEISGGTWNLSADYDGLSDVNWVHDAGSNVPASAVGNVSEWEPDPTDGHMADSTLLVSAWTPRNQR